MAAKKAGKRKRAKKAGKAKRGGPIDLSRVAAGAPSRGGADEADEGDEARAALAPDKTRTAPGTGEAGPAAEGAPAPEEPVEGDGAQAFPERGEVEAAPAPEASPAGDRGGGDEAPAADAAPGADAGSVQPERGDKAEAEDREEVAAEAARAPGLRLRAAVEAVVFAADDPVTPAQVAKAVGAKPASVRKAIEEIRERLDATASGLALEEIAGGLQFMTREEHAPAIRKLRKSSERKRLTAAALETLAVVAYKQPVQRQEIEDIRGVSCGPILRTLMERGLVKIAGRADVLGRPLLYGTTKRFLDTFGLGSTKDLPKVGELGPK